MSDQQIVIDDLRIQLEHWKDNYARLRRETDPLKALEATTDSRELVDELIGAIKRWSIRGGWTEIFLAIKAIEDAREKIDE